MTADALDQLAEQVYATACLWIPSSVGVAVVVFDANGIAYSVGPTPSVVADKLRHVLRAVSEPGPVLRMVPCELAEQKGGR